MTTCRHDSSAHPSDGDQGAGSPPNRPSGAGRFGLHVTRMRGGRVVISVTGALDLSTVDALRATAHQEIQTGARQLVLDLSAMPFWDSSGMGAVASVYRRAARVGASVALAGLSSTLEKKYRLTGMDRVVPLHGDVCTALARPESES
ncbi:STAS domain-containing protein [Streptomyces sp. NPDC055709]